MAELDDLLRSAFDESTTEAESHPALHISCEELVRFADGQLSKTGAERVRAHILECSECLQEALDARRFPDLEPVKEEFRLSASEVRDRWNSFEAKLRAEPLAAKRLPSTRTSWHPQLSRAAALAVCLLGAVLLWNSLGPKDPFGGTAVNTGIFSLLPSTTEVRPVSRSNGDSPEPEGIELIQLNPQREAVLLILNVSNFEDTSDYEATLFRVGEEKAVWHSKSIRRTQDLNFNLTLQRPALEDGLYTLDLSRVTTEGPSRIARYRMKVVSAD